MDRALLNELKARQIAFLEARLVSEAAARDFRERLPAGFAALLATPLGELVDAGAIGRARGPCGGGAAPAGGPARGRRGARGARRGGARRAAAREGAPAGGRPRQARSHPRAAEDRAGAARARGAGERGARRGDARRPLRHADGVLREGEPVLRRVGPARALKRVAPFGLGGVGKTMGADAGRVLPRGRLEPEIRRLLQGFSRTAMRQGASISSSRRATRLSSSACASRSPRVLE